MSKTIQEKTLGRALVAAGSQAALALAMKVSSQTVRNWKRDPGSIRSRDLERLADIAGCRLELADHDDPPRSVLLSSRDVLRDALAGRR